ncbi:MAG: hypothetical protein PHX61_03465 [Alphaproteobacteria bacterium]|nr:hypothetical protein [Alphaproteobacteria bacterium]
MTDQFEHLLEGDEVERFLAAFVLPEDVRNAARDKSPTVKFPENTNDVLQDVKSIWNEKGFLSPAELRAELFEKYSPNSDATFKKFVTDIELSRNVPESVTGYLSKEHAYIATGLGHLYATETGRAISMAEVDFSNMGGTNKEFEKRIAQERGIPVDQVDPKDAERLTDDAVKLLSDSMTSTLAKELPEGAKIVPIRTGGDELRLMFTGIEDPSELNRIKTMMHVAIEQHVAAMGLQDHPHLKDPTNQTRNGFGAAIAIQDMRNINVPATLIQELDERIKIEKEVLGKARLGLIDEKSTVQKIEMELDSGKIKIPDGMDKDTFLASGLETKRQRVKNYADTLHSRNPLHNPLLEGGVKGFTSYIDSATSAMADTPLVFRPLPEAVANDNYSLENRPRGLGPLSSLEDRRSVSAESFLRTNFVDMSGSDRFFLGQSIKNMTPIDPSAQVMMPKDMIAMIGIYGTEAEEFRNTIDPTDPKTAEALKGAGLRSVDDISPHVMAVSFHNLAGLNNQLGHHNADLVLRHMGSEIIASSMESSGLGGDEKTGKKPYIIAHHGGGNFSVLIDPAVHDKQGSLQFVSEGKVAEVEKEIAKRTIDLNGQSVGDFLERGGVKVDDNIRKSLAMDGASTFAGIEDPKERAMTSNREITGRVNGIHVATATEIVDGGRHNLSGASFVSRVRTQADLNLNALRDNKILEQSPIKNIPEGVKVSATAEETHPKTMNGAPESRVHAVGGAGVGVGMGVYGLVQKLGENGTLQTDLKNPETKNLAQAGTASDIAAVAVDGADGLASLQKASKGLQTAAKVSRIAAPVGVALSVVSGTIDYKIAAKQGDGARAAEAVGGTAGGIAGAATGGVVGAKAGAMAGAAIGAFFGGVGAAPGAVIGGFVGGLAGAIGGAFAGAEAGKKVAESTIKDSLQKKFDEERAGPERSNNVRTRSQSASSVSNTTQTPKIEQPLRPVEGEKFAKSAPDLGNAFKVSAENERKLDLSANDARLKVESSNNKMYMGYGL